MSRTNLPNIEVKPFRNPSGEGVWRLEARINGRRIRKNFGEKVEAEAARDKLLGSGEQVLRRTTLTPDDLRRAELAASEYPLADILAAGLEVLRNRPAIQPVEPLAKQFVGHVRAFRGERWAKDCEWKLGQLLAAHPALTTDKLTLDLAHAHLSQFANPTTRRNHRSVLSRFGTWLSAEKRILPTNFAAGIKIFSAKADDATPPAIFTPSQADALIEACLKHDNCRRALGWLALGLYCGLRPGECERLQWSQIDWKRKRLVLAGRKVGSVLRFVPLRAKAEKLLRIVEKDGEPTPGGHWRKPLKNACKAAGVEWSHDICRHSYASYRLGDGAAVEAVAAEMGNSPRVLAKHYLNLPTPEAARKWWA